MTVMSVAPAIFATAPTQVVEATTLGPTGVVSLDELDELPHAARTRAAMTTGPRTTVALVRRGRMVNGAFLRMVNGAFL